MKTKLTPTDTSTELELLKKHNEKLTREVRFLISLQTPMTSDAYLHSIIDNPANVNKEYGLYLALAKMVDVYREGQENPDDEPQVVAEAIRALKRYEESKK
jgi:hypothetical protein